MVATVAEGAQLGSVTNRLPTDIEWRTSAGLTPYADALAEMEARAVAVGSGDARELLWMLEQAPRRAT
jgi:lipoyl(octanoyl) transferase